MNRQFLSLYFFIVITVIGVGLTLDVLWNKYADINITPHEESFIQLATDYINNKNNSNNKKEKISERKKSLGKYTIDIFSLEDFADSQLQKKLSRNQTIKIYTAKNTIHLYKKIHLKHQDSILRITLLSHKKQHSLRLWLVAAFYLCLGITVFFWISPLSRDIKKLEKQTKIIGEDGIPEKVSVPISSNVIQLANAYNSMIDRLQSLVASHKEMTYAVSHELRTPLARLKFALAMAENKNNPPTTQTQLNNLQTDIQDMDKLINQLLSYASFEQHNTTLLPKAGDINALLNSLLIVVQKKYPAIQFKIDNQQANNIIECDWTLMERVMINLLENAGRYAKHTVLICIKDHNHDYMMTNIIEVHDDGIGVTAEETNRIFQAFVRIRNTVNADNQGFGLGLAIVKRILKWHGGTANVGKSHLGGAKFELQWAKTSDY